MPEGKPAGVACVHLDERMACTLINDPRRPALCADFTAEFMVCGTNRAEALVRLAQLEALCLP